MLQARLRTLLPHTSSADVDATHLLVCEGYRDPYRDRNITGQRRKCRQPQTARWTEISIKSPSKYIRLQPFLFSLQRLHQSNEIADASALFRWLPISSACFHWHTFPLISEGVCHESGASVPRYRRQDSGEAVTNGRLLGSRKAEPLAQPRLLGAPCQGESLFSQTDVLRPCNAPGPWSHPSLRLKV